MNEQHHRSSLFWPIILVGMGAILLLRNLEILPDFSWSLLFKLWPLLLIVLGLDILFGRKTPWVGTLVGLFAVGAVIAVLYFAPSFGFNTSSSPLVTETLTAPLENTESVDFYIEGSAEPVNVTTLTNKTELIHADVTHTGTMYFDVTGDAAKKVSLSQSASPDSWLDWNLSFEKRFWDIALTSEIPAEVLFDGGSGAIDMDLTGMQLETFKANFGSGASKIILPVSAEGYAVELESGSGAMNVTLPTGTDLTISLDSGSGAVSIHLPAGYALSIEVMDDGSGALNLPTGLIKVSGGTSSSGTWQTSGFEDAESQVIVRIINRGSGSININ